MKRWFVLIILAVSQFVMILDSTVMNVSISTVAHDLGTTISGMQAAITFYALTMAAFMLTGGKLGDKLGKLRAFRIGSVVYGVGSLTTALSPTLGVLLFGWSFVEGLGAVLIIPAIAALTAVNYQGRSRVTAFAILGATTGLAAAVGPLIGGLVTTYFSWRYVFAAETVVMVCVLFVANKIQDEGSTKSSPIDVRSSMLSALGMALLVFGVLQSKTWGWIRPLSAPTLNGHAIEPFGVSLTAYLILMGVIVLKLFVSRQRKLEATGKVPLLKVSMLSIPALRSGLAVLMSQYFVIAALFFVIPVYLQTILGYDALQTGLKLVPLSIGLMLFSVLGSRLAATRTAKNISRYGQLALAAGSLLVLASIAPELRGLLFWVGLLTVGAGFGLLASQIGNVTMSAVSRKDTAGVGGLQGTFQNLGTSFGTAVAGSIFMLTLTTGFTTAVQSSDGLTPQAKSSITSQSSEGVQIVSQSQLEKYVASEGGTQQTADTVGNLYQHSQLDALRQAMFIVFAIAVLSLFFSRNLPANSSGSNRA
jgi:MFS family permease